MLRLRKNSPHEVQPFNRIKPPYKGRTRIFRGQQQNRFVRQMPGMRNQRGGKSQRPLNKKGLQALQKMEKELKTQTPVIKCTNLTVAYGSHKVIQNLSFELFPGQYLCVLGKNGTGKTTLIKALLGLIQPKEGEITVNSRGTGYLPQQKDIKRDFPASVKEIVLSGCLSLRKKEKNLLKRLNPFYIQTEKKLCAQAMFQMEIGEFKNKSFKELSGGQQQRTLLARTLCASRDLIVLDEPVTGLDPLVTDEFYTLVKKLNTPSRDTPLPESPQKEHSSGFTKEGLPAPGGPAYCPGPAILMVSHDLERSLKDAGLILHLDEKDYFFGTTEEYLKTGFYKSLSGNS